MIVAVSPKHAIARLGEVIFLFIFVPALLVSVLLHVDEGNAYIVVHGQDVTSGQTVDKKLALAASAEDYLRQFPDGDVSYQLRFAVDYLRDGTIADWVLNLWPPGMPALYWSILRLTGSDHFPLKIVVVSAFVYALALYLFYRSLASNRASPTVMVACALPLLCASFLKSIFLDIHLFSSDFYCFALLAILLSLIFKGGTPSLSRLTMMATTVAALAYFRSYYFLFIKLLSVGAVCTFALWAVCGLVTKGWNATIRLSIHSKPVASIGIFLVATWLLLLPWKVFLVESGRTFDWTMEDQVWAAQWRSDLPHFLIGMNTPCVLEKDICEQLMPFQHPDTWTTPRLGSRFYKRLSIATFVSSPIMWYEEKAKIFHYFWFDGDKFNWKLPPLQLVRYIQSASLLVACAGLVLLTGIRLMRNAASHAPILENNGLYVLFVTFFIFNWLLFTFAHYEARYSIPLKWVTYLFSIFLLKRTMFKLDLLLSRCTVGKGSR
jgi:hypothetical protein